MSSLHADAGLPATRTQSLRLPAKALMKASSSTTAPTAPPAPHAPSTTSHVSLFLTNLRLLDLDQEPDWPAITQATFSATEAAAGQKKRIQAVEWLLYQLCMLWDEKEARHKLKPFYPPLDQVQSINLRAALLRCLEQAKKNGILGRDAVVRKTMLDECKGERLEEVLAVFSTAVLKKMVAERALNSGAEYRPTISDKIALENRGYTGERTELNGLLLAHKVSLRGTLEDKDAARTRYRDFEELLAVKEKTVTRREEQLAATLEHQAGKRTSSKLRTEIKQLIKTTWAANDQWIDAILYNDTGAQKAGLLNSPFDDVWSRVQDGRFTELEDASVGLLQQLEQRVHLQKTRLEKWQDLRNTLFGDEPNAAPETETEDTSTGFGLAGRELHKLEEVRPEDLETFKMPGAPPEYAAMLEAMKAELERIDKPKMPAFSSLVGTGNRRALSSETMPEEKDVPEVFLDTTGVNQAPQLPDPVVNTLAMPGARHGRQASIARPRAHLSTKPSRMQGPAKPADIEMESSTPSEVIEAQQDTTVQLSKHVASVESATLAKSQSMSASPTLTLPNGEIGSATGPNSKVETDINAMSPPPPSISPTQAMADEILESMANATPSPTKKPRHALTLAERTHLSMTRTGSSDHGGEIDAQQLSPSMTTSNGRRAHMQASVNGPLTSRAEYGDRGEGEDGLMERTRRSMAGFQAAKEQAQLDRKRSQKQSRQQKMKDNYFPKLDEEDDTSIVQELLEAGPVDKDLVFRSRPKMRTSPTPTKPSSICWDPEIGDGRDD